MANMHVRGGDGVGAEIVCHFAIAATNNAVGLSWRTAYGRTFLPGAPVSVLPDGDGTLGTIAAAEKTTVNTLVPAVAEVLLRFAFPSDWAGLSGANRNARLDAWYAAVLAEFTAAFSARLQYSGYTR